MAITKIMIIRHAEKPTDDGSLIGVSAEGSQDPEELVVRGWQRSGALVRFFKPSNGQFAHPALATPDVVFASQVAEHSKSLRPQHTVLAVAELLDQQIDVSHALGDEDELVQDVLGRTGSALIAWEHKAIIGIANQILGKTTASPQHWPGSRFDLVWVFDRDPKTNEFQLTQVPQLLLPQDSSQILPLS